MNSTINLAIIGAQKAGTTSLNKYLAQHPNIYTHFTQEFSMLASPEDFNNGLEKNINDTVQKSILENPEKNCFVAKRVGVMYNEEMMQRFYQAFPDCKIIVILRNPVDRAYSAFKYCRMSGMEPYKKFEDAIFINDESRFKDKKFKRNCDYIFRSSYLKPLKNIYKIFPADNVQIYLFEEIMKNLNQPLNEMVSMLNLPQFEFDTNKNYNEGAVSKSAMLSKTIAPGNFGILKKLFSTEQRMKLKLFLKKLNADKGKPKQEKLQPQTREHLINTFKSEVTELEFFLSLPIKKYWPDFF
ncbi:MAG: sulfotransferase domain-containing protein [Parafilimonas sp.]